MKKSCPVIALALLLTTFGLYWQTRSFDFIGYDDQLYVFENATTNGLNAATVKWAFTDSYKTLDNWHPLTVLTLLADVSLSGGWKHERDKRVSSVMHLHNAVIHAINAVLVFYFLLLLLRCMEGGTAASPSAGIEADAPPSSAQHVEYLVKKPLFTSDRLPLLICLAAFIGAAFWAWHPLRVESVAWVSSRKDVYCVFFCLCAFVASLKWRDSELGFLVSLFAYALAYMSKPTAVTLPVGLILMDYLVFKRIYWRRMVVWAVMALFFVGFVIIAQEKAIADCYPLNTRLNNALVSVWDYLYSTVWPMTLCPFYPYEDPVSLIRLILGGLICIYVLVFIAFPVAQGFIWDARQSLLGKGCATPPVTQEVSVGADMFAVIALGILWFFISLLPVIGIIHVGFASHADRYTYLSGIGLSIVLASLLYRILWKNDRRWTTVVLVFSCSALFVLGVKAYLQTGLWQNSMKLFTYALDHTEENFIAHSVVSSVHCREKRFDKSFEHMRLSLATYERADMNPEKRMEACLFLLFREEGHGNLSCEDMLDIQVRDGERLAAEKLYAQAAMAYGRELSSAENFIKDSLRLKPGDGYSWELYARILLSQDRKEEANEALKKAHELLPARKTILKLMHETGNLKPGATCDTAGTSRTAGTGGTGDRGDVSHVEK